MQCHAHFASAGLQTAVGCKRKGHHTEAMMACASHAEASTQVFWTCT